jgi:phage terminase large subunit GpA-like protein
VDFAWGRENDVEASYSQGLLSSAGLWYSDAYVGGDERLAAALQLDAYESDIDTERDTFDLGPART